MSYFRLNPARWEREHYQAVWSEDNPAPEWWAAIDAAWMLDRLALPTERVQAEAWGWTRRKTARFLNEMLLEQSESEPRPERKAAILSIRKERAPRARTEPVDEDSQDQKRASPVAEKLHNPELKVPEPSQNGARIEPEASHTRVSSIPTATAKAYQAEPPTQEDPPPIEVQLPSGNVTVPGDLFQLLYGVRAGNRDAVRSLLDMGVETTAQLLELTADQRQYTKGNPGPLVWSAIQKHLQARYGIGLGALQHQPATTGTPADWTAACTATRTKSYDGLSPNIRQAIRDVGGSAAFAARNDFTEKDLRARFLARVGELNSKQERT